MKLSGNRFSKKNLFYSAPTKVHVKADAPRPSPLMRFIAWFWRNFLKICTLLGFMIIASAVLSSLYMRMTMPKGGIELPSKIVLQMTLKGTLPEKPQKAPVLAALGISKPSLYEITTALKQAKDDPKIKAFVLEIQPGSYAPPQLTELREAILDFKTSEKPLYVYAPSYEVTSSGLSGYYIASIFDEIWMQPVGMLSLTGFHTEQPYLKELMDWFGVKANVFKRKEYKNAMDSVTRSDMSPEEREAMQTLLGDMHDKISKEISASRGIAENIFESYVNVGILTDQEALEAKLVDRLGYGDELVHELNKRLGGTDDEMIPYISLEQYITFNTHGIISPLQILSKMAKEKLGYTEKPHGEIALIFAQGPITQYEPPNHGFDMGQPAVIAADKVAEYIYNAAHSEQIKTIVLRIDSPGGSPQASETIRRALIKAKEEGKRVVISMGYMCASGGYWIASAGDHIFANSMTITGSIGVVGAKFDMSGFWDKVMVNWEALNTAQNADLFSVSTPLSEAGRERYQEMMDTIYSAFINRVAEGRNLSYSTADELAGGRVWSGMRAQQNKLVDDIGGLNAALEWAAKDLGHETVNDAGVIIVPSPRAGLDALLSLLGVSVGRISATSQQIGDIHAALENSPAAEFITLGKQVQQYQKGINTYSPIRVE